MSLTKQKFDLSSLLPSEAFKEPSLPKQKPDRLLQDLKALRRLFTKPYAWIQGDWSDGQGGFCMEGGIGKVTKAPDLEDVSEDKDTRTGRLYRAVARQIGQIGYVSIPGWNDEEERTIDEILGAIDGAIKARMEELALEQARAAHVTS